MSPLKALALSMVLFSSFVMANTGKDKPTKKSKNSKTQTHYMIKRAPLGLINMPAEALYRLGRALDIHKWDQMMKKEEIQHVLSKSHALRAPTDNDVFPFQNFMEDFEGVVHREFGVCSGFSTLQRNFNILMQFDPQNKHKAVVPSKEKDPEGYDLFFKKLIDRATKFHPVIIPQFENMNQFFSEPSFQVHGKLAIVKMWARNNATIQGIEQFAKANHQFPQKKWKKLHRELKERLDAGYNPIIYASFNPTDHIKYNIHVIQVTGVSDYRADGTFEIHVWDDGVLKDFFGDFKAEKLMKVITFRPDGAIWWLESDKYLNLPFNNPKDLKMMDLRQKELIDETLWIGLLPNDDKIMSKVMKKKVRWCASKKEFNKYCL